MHFQHVCQLIACIFGCHKFLAFYLSSNERNGHALRRPVLLDIGLDIRGLKLRLTEVRTLMPVAINSAAKDRTQQPETVALCNGTSRICRRRRNSALPPEYPYLLHKINFF